MKGRSCLEISNMPAVFFWAVCILLWAA